MKLNGVEVAKRGAHLDRLLEKLEGKSDREIEEKGRRLYQKLYLTSGRQGVLKAHDGAEVYFWRTRFDHAFYEAIDWKVSNEKTGISKARVARIRWIAEFIAGRFLVRSAG